MDQLIKEALKESEKIVGKTALRLITERIIYDLSITDDNLKNLKIPVNPVNIDLSKLSDEEKKVFYYQLAEILGAVVNPQIKKKLLKRLEEYYGEA
ncbi:hypothetical protein [Thermosulfidibacter takaii]|uniref:hypothetical protein n=1 Tax=Thermosulfidibacter takaii TaxID=412593 RepID=UPI000838E7DD|nr:hypothetical protein [Thermosulfidibacter takaii]